MVRHSVHAWGGGGRDAYPKSPFPGYTGLSIVINFQRGAACRPADVLGVKGNVGPSRLYPSGFGRQLKSPCTIVI